jgi:hypothetical protein
VKGLGDERAQQLLQLLQLEADGLTGELMLGHLVEVGGSKHQQAHDWRHHVPYAAAS